MLCAKFHSDHFITTWMRAEWNFHQWELQWENRLWNVPLYNVPLHTALQWNGRASIRLWTLTTDIPPPWVNLVLTLFEKPSQIAEFIWATWGPPESCRPQVGPTSAPMNFAVRDVVVMFSFKMRIKQLKWTIVWICPIWVKTSIKLVVMVPIYYSSQPPVSRDMLLL